MEKVVKAWLISTLS